MLTVLDLSATEIPSVLCCIVMPGVWGRNGYYGKEYRQTRSRKLFDIHCKTAVHIEPRNAHASDAFFILHPIAWGWNPLSLSENHRSMSENY
mmetsp:Transcript_62859/g.128121  ORF Transcript_62859/g.128121 Transcript_62859/m.128121 type:complete len:92 (+) Transcript_62859:316-591(+)